METLKLRRVQQPTELERLLESYISSTKILPDGAYPIREERGVPRELLGVLSAAIANGQTWACWTRGIQTWLFTCEMSLALSRERGMPVLRVSVFGDDGALKSSGTWLKDQRGTWHQCAD